MTEIFVLCTMIFSFLFFLIPAFSVCFDWWAKMIQENFNR